MKILNMSFLSVILALISMPNLVQAKKMSADQQDRQRWEQQMREENSKTPQDKLIWAIGECNVQEIKEALKEGADINFLYKIMSAMYTPLMLAVIVPGVGEEIPLKKRIAAIETLLENGANVNKTNHEGDTVLVHAIQNLRYDTEGDSYFDKKETIAYIKILDMLLQAGADIYLRDNKGFTPFDIARMRNLPQVLLDKLNPAH